MFQPRRRTLAGLSISRWGATLVLFAAIGTCCSIATARDPDRLDVMAGGYPRAFFFRSSEGFAANVRVPYDRWEAAFSRLMGIQGKVLDEEVPGRARRNIDFFSRFKREHPNQMVLLHYNGNARDPRYQTQGKYFAGHWIYYNGAKILADVPAEEGESEILVSDPSLFRTSVGRYRDKNEDVGICALDDTGKPNWHQSEQVQLVSVDPARKTIRVRRGCYGTEPRAFRAGAAYAAAHVHEGPWGRRSNLMWYYNHATCCPRDETGRACADVHVDELARRFADDGELSAFDGIQFDVLHHYCGRTTGGRGPDCDADGQVDGGEFDGVNRYGAGVVLFCRQLRAALGENTLILADGHNWRHQRAFGLLNGIESEGWPALGDWEIKDWSGGLNRHAFWRANGRAPTFSYVNHKFTMAGEKPGQRVRPEVPWNVHRLVFAAAVFTDSAICYSFTPPARPGEMIGIWDELIKGTENQPGWLGKPLGAPVRLAKQSPDLLDPLQGGSLVTYLLNFTGDDVRFELIDGKTKVTSRRPESGQLRFVMPNVRCQGPDLFFTVTARAEAMTGYPPETARLAWVGIAPDQGQLIRERLPTCGMALRGAAESAMDTESGASVRWSSRCTIGGKTLPAYLVHPPYRGGTGYTFWYRDVAVPGEGRLEFFTGMGEKSPARSDGVVFRVELAEITGDGVADFEKQFEHLQVEHRWIGHQVPLKPWAGKQVRLKFISDCGPQDNSTTDHSYWGDAVVVGAAGRSGLTAPKRHMTWMNDGRHGGNSDAADADTATADGAAFESAFYFSDVKSEKVDLEFVVEGSEPIWLEAVSAYAHPDVVYREFEHGLVLANPSPRPFVFDLERRFPGAGFRRLRGSDLQDTATNDGRQVGDKVELGPRDALFLVRE